MCECNCGEINSLKYLKIHGKSPRLTVSLYDGCEQCWQGIGVDLYFWQNHTEFEADNNPEIVNPDEYGSNNGHGIKLEIFSIENMIKAAKEIWDNGNVIGPEGNDYANIEDWLRDFGLKMIQDAIRKTAKKDGV